MKRITALFFFISIFTTFVSAQKYYFPGKTDPIRTTFTTDSILFSELLSAFSARCQQYDTLTQVEWFNPLNAVDKVPLDAKYEKILMMVPFFKSYPAFRIDCPNGYILGIFNRYQNSKSIVDYLDLLSFDLKGKMIDRISLAHFNIANYVLDDEKTSQDFLLGSVVDMANGEIHYTLERCSYMIDNSTYFKNDYRYKIQDDATLKLLSIDYNNDK